VSASCLAGGVGELAVAGALHLATDRGNVYDLAGVAGCNFTALGEEGKHGHCHEVLAGHVGLESLSPLMVFGPQEVLADSVCVGHVWLAIGGC
jgi:hypothetical protein